MPTLSKKWVYNSVIDCSRSYVFDGEYNGDIIFVIDNGICYWDNISANLHGATIYVSSISPENDNLYPFMFSDLKLDGYPVEVGKTNVPEVGDYIIDPKGKLFKIGDVYGDTADADAYATLNFVYTVSDGWNKYDYRVVNFGSEGTEVSDKFYYWFIDNARTDTIETEHKLITVESLSAVHEHYKNVYVSKQDGAIGLANMFAAGYIVLSPYQYGDDFPSDYVHSNETKGTMFLKKA